jgi:transcriptional regulator with XRE-family HTH domain
MARSSEPSGERWILNDVEAKTITAALGQWLGGSLGSTLAHAGIDVEAMVRFHSVGQRCSTERESKSLTIADAAKQLKVPQYRLRAIEKGSLGEIQPAVLRRYIQLLGLTAWYAEWSSANPALAAEIEEGRIRRPTRSVSTPIAGGADNSPGSKR